MKLVKLLTYDNGVSRMDNKWHLVLDITDRQTLCQGEYYGADSGNDSEYQEKTVEKGAVTCSACFEIIRKIKSIEL